MDNKQAVVYRKHFRRVVGTTPVLIASTGGRWALIMQNEGPADIYAGISGLKISENSMLIANGKSLSDNYSKDDWWAVTASSSGTMSGFELV